MTGTSTMITLWNGKTIPRLGMGCWAIGGPFYAGDVPLGWGEVDDDESIAAVHRALDLGIGIFDTASNYGAGHSEEVLGKALVLQRKAQWRLDFIAAENSMGFHAPQEAARILGEAIDYARQGQVALLGGATSAPSTASGGAGPAASAASSAAPSAAPVPKPSGAPSSTPRP